MAATASRRYSSLKLEPSRQPHLASTRAIQLAVSQTYQKGFLLGEITGTNEIQTLTLGGTGGTSTFTLTFNGKTTGTIAWSSTNATLLANIQAALDALSTVGAGNSVVADSNLSSGIGDLLVTFVNGQGSIDQPLITRTIVSGSLTITAAQTTQGVAGSNGIYNLMSTGASNGTQTPKAICPFDCITDASGNITLGSVAGGGDNGTVFPCIYAWFGGIFFCNEVFYTTGQTIATKTQLDATRLTALVGRLVEGSFLVRGEFRF